MLWQLSHRQDNAIWHVRRDHLRSLPGDHACLSFLDKGPPLTHSQWKAYACNTAIGLDEIKKTKDIKIDQDTAAAYQGLMALVKDVPMRYDLIEKSTLGMAIANCRQLWNKLLDADIATFRESWKEQKQTVIYNEPL